MIYRQLLYLQQSTNVTINTSICHIPEVGGGRGDPHINIFCFHSIFHKSTSSRFSCHFQHCHKHLLHHYHHLYLQVAAMASNHSELAEMCGHLLAAPIIPDYVMTIIQVCPLLFVNYHSNMMTMMPVGQVFALKNLLKCQFFSLQVFYALVCMLGLLGNSLVIYVVLRFSKMHTVMKNYFWR